MSKIKLYFMYFILLGLICVNAPAVFAEGEAYVGKAVPSFTVKDIDGNEIDINSFKGNKTVLINFWGLRCGSCIEEMPHLNTIYDNYKDKDFVILGVNGDGIDGDFLKSPRGMANLPVELKYTIVQDPEMKLIDIFKMEAAPLNVLIDKEGIVQFYHMGYEAGEEKVLEEKVKEVVK